MKKEIVFFILFFFAQQLHGKAYFVCFFSSLHIEFINVLVTVKFFHQKYVLLLVRTELGGHEGFISVSHIC